MKCYNHCRVHGMGLIDWGPFVLGQFISNNLIVKATMITPLVESRPFLCWLGNTKFKAEFRSMERSADRMMKLHGELFQGSEKLGKFTWMRICILFHHSYRCANRYKLGIVYDQFSHTNPMFHKIQYDTAEKWLLWMVQQIIRSISQKHTDFKYQCSV